MKNLLWKDYRQNRRVLLGTSILVFLPYPATLGFCMAQTELWQQLAGVICAMSFIGVYLATGMAAFIAGNALAGERADRSAEFAGYLPIRRVDALMSKLLLAVASCAILTSVNIAIHYGTKPWALHPERWDGEALLFTTASAILLFGVAWMVSSFSSSPAIAAASGLGTLLVLAGSLAMLDSYRIPPTGLVKHSCFDWYPLLCVVIGLACFAGGTAYYLRRVEP